MSNLCQRVHLYYGFYFLGMGVPGFFDPFLPCNSHHIHGTRRRAEGQEASANTNTSSSTSQSTGTSTESPPRAASEAPSVVNLFSNLLSGRPHKDLKNFISIKFTPLLLGF